MSKKLVFDDKIEIIRIKSKKLKANEIDRNPIKNECKKT